MDILEICKSSYHIIHVIIYASLISYFKIMHIGPRRRSNPTGIWRRGRGQSRDTPTRSSRRRGASHWWTFGVPWSPTHLFPERQAPEHSRPPMFYKISLESFMFDALGYKSWFRNTWCIELPCPDIYFKPWVGPGSNICLPMLRPVEVGWFPVICEI